MTTAIVIIVIYLASAWKVWDWFKKAYSNNGIMSYMVKFSLIEFILCVLPIVNSVFAIVHLFIPPYKRNYNKFFRVKK
jgi:hypothetical protein